MSERTRPEQENLHATVHLVPVVTCPRPTDIQTYILKQEFETLCKGDTNKEQAKRDNAKHIFWAAVIGLIGVLASADWTVLNLRQRPWPFYFFIVAFLLAIAWFGNEWRITAQRVKDKQSESAYVSLKAGIQRRLDDAAAFAAALTEKPQGDVEGAAIDAIAKPSSP